MILLNFASRFDRIFVRALLVFVVALMILDGYLFMNLFGMNPIDVRIVLLAVAIGIVWYWVTGE